MTKKRVNILVMAGMGLAASFVMAGCDSIKLGDKKSDIQSVVASGHAESKVDFLTEVKPLLEYYCLRCHNTGQLLGDLNLETRELAFASGEGGPLIIPKHPEASKLYHVLKLHEGNKEAMPPVKHRMTEEQRKIIYRWIRQGADWPKDSRGTLRPVMDRPVVAMAD